MSLTDEDATTPLNDGDRGVKMLSAEFIGHA